MEEQKGIVYVIIACSIITVAIGIGFILFIIEQKRKRHTYESVIEILETQKDVKIQKLEQENEEIKIELKELRDLVVNCMKS